MCEDRKVTFFASLFWTNTKGESKFHSLELRYGQGLEDMDDLSDFLMYNPKVLGLGKLDIPQESEVHVLVGAWCETCDREVGFKLNERWVLNREVLVDDIIESATEMHPQAFIFASNLVGEVEDWLDLVETEDPDDDQTVEELEEIGGISKYVPVPNSEFSSLN